MIDYAKKENKLLMYIGDFNRQLDYLYKLIKIINVQNLTQACTHVVFPVYIICRYNLHVW